MTTYPFIQRPLALPTRIYPRADQFWFPRFVQNVVVQNVVGMYDLLHLPRSETREDIHRLPACQVFVFRSRERPSRGTVCVVRQIKDRSCRMSSIFAVNNRRFDPLGDASVTGPRPDRPAYRHESRGMVHTLEPSATGAI